MLTSGGSILANVYWIIFFPSYLFLLSVFGIGYHFNIFIHTFVVLMQGFALGVIVGWIYGKIKK